MPTLYLVPTPLGDPDDITLRALRILREASAIAADDFGTARLLLDTHGITTPIIDDDAVLEALSHGDVALVTRYGTPGMGDAAQAVVREAIAWGVRVEPLPGANAAITALVLSGLPTEAFVYVGKVPNDLTPYMREHDTLIFATNDLTEAVMKLLTAFGDRRVCMTQLTATAWVYRGRLSDAANYDRTQPSADGIIIVVQGAPEEIAEVWGEARVRIVLREHLQHGEPLKLAAKAVAAAAGWDRRAVYALGVEMKHD